MIELILVDPKAELCTEWNKTFESFPEVTTFQGYFEELQHYDCMVSAANSFGLMDGGVDLAIIQYFGKDLEKRVQTHILENYRGEQPVGSSFIIPTFHDKHPFIAHTPTMRVPMSIIGTDNIYLAMKAMLETVWQHNLSFPHSKIEKIACPGLGTSTGRVPLKEAARQMALAYKNFKFPLKNINWQIATQRHYEIKFPSHGKH